MAHSKVPLTLDVLKQQLHYDPITGGFRWLVSRGCVKAGASAGTISRGYLRIKVAGKIRLAHHLAWFYMTGTWPTLIDHADRNRGNNVFGNLREATKSQSNQNRSARKNKSGYTGVALLKNGKFMAYIGVNGTRITLGYFASAKLASDAYMAAAQKHHREYAASL